MDWNKVGAIGSAIGGLCGAVAFIITIWPWPQLKGTTWHGPGPKLIGVSLMVSFALSAWAIYGAWRPHSQPFKVHPYNELKLVENQQFINEEIELDGKLFRKCRFVGARLMFHANESFGLEESGFSPPLVLTTDDPRARAVGESLVLLLRDVNLVSHDSVGLDGKGGIVLQPSKSSASTPKATQQ